MATGPRLIRAAGIRDDEVAVVGLIAAVFATLEAGRGLGEVGVNTLVLTRLPGDALPWLYIPLGIISLVIAVAFGGALGRVRRARLTGFTLIGIGALLAVEWIALGRLPDAVPVAWLTVMAAGAIAVTIGWTVATSTLDARQAKRLFPICTAAAIAGNFVGSLAAGPVTRAASADALVGLEGALFVLAAILIGRLARRSRTPAWGAPPTTSHSIIKDVRSGFDEVRGSPLLRLVAVAYVLFAVLLFSVSFPFLRAARATFPDDASLAGALGLIGAVVTATSFVVSLVVAKPFYRRFGVAAAALILPVVYLVGFSVWIIQFTFVTAAAVSIVQQVTQRGLSNAAWSAFYNVVPSARRAQALAFNDGVPGQLGIMLSGVLLLTAGRFFAPEQVFWLGFATAVACTITVVAIRRRYADALLRTLRGGTGEQILEGGRGLGDLVDTPDVRKAIIATMTDPDGALRAMAAAMLARSPAPDARRALVDALDDPDPRVRGAAVAAVLAAGDQTGAPSSEAARAERVMLGLLGGDAAARVAGLHAMHGLRRDMDPSSRAAAIADPVPAVRAAAMGVLGVASDDASTEALLAGLADPASIVRGAASSALASRDAVAPGLVERLSASTIETQMAAIGALEGHGDAVRPEVVAWADLQVGRALTVAGASAALTAAAGDPSGSLAFLVGILDGRTQRYRDLALAAMAVLGAPAARGVIRRSLRSGDADIRAQAIEALDSIGDRRLGAAIARLVEFSPPPDPEPRDTVIRALCDDADAWVRGLARWIQSDGDDMADLPTSLTTLDTMLQLRAVPLFERLAPEDLERIAAVATERWFEPGEPLVREGDLGDELFVILEGRVQVHRQEPDGSERVIRTYDAGDHIGELAVLRERPRVATVVAQGGNVRTLVLGGEGLTTILRERPDAAMAMLATLAERISAQ